VWLVGCEGGDSNGLILGSTWPMSSVCEVNVTRVALWPEIWYSFLKKKKKGLKGSDPVQIGLDPTGYSTIFCSTFTK